MTLPKTGKQTCLQQEKKAQTEETQCGRSNVCFMRSSCRTTAEAKVQSVMTFYSPTQPQVWWHKHIQQHRPKPRQQRVIANDLDRPAAVANGAPAGHKCEDSAVLGLDQSDTTRISSTHSTVGYVLIPTLYARMCATQTGNGNMKKNTKWNNSSLRHTGGFVT